MDTEILEDLGLTRAEIKVYLTLLKLKSSHAAQVLSNTNLQSSVIFRSLNSLIEKGLISYILEGRRKIYQATSPKSFYQYMDEKKRRFDELLPELEKYEQATKQEDSTSAYKGMRGVKEVYRIMRETKGEYNSFGGGISCLEAMGDAWWKNHHIKRVASKLPARQVFDETVREIGEWNNKKGTTEVRFLHSDFASFQETVIVGDKVAITVFGENPYAFLIQDNAIANGYRKHFEILWTSAKK